MLSKPARVMMHEIALGIPGATITIKVYKDFWRCKELKTVKYMVQVKSIYCEYSIPAYWFKKHFRYNTGKFSKVASKYIYGDIIACINDRLENGRYFTF